MPKLFTFSNGKIVLIQNADESEIFIGPYKKVGNGYIEKSKEECDEEFILLEKEKKRKKM